MFGKNYLKKKYLLNIEMSSDCYAIAKQNCFPTSAAEVYADAAASQVACYAINCANLNRYENAFCPPSPYCFTPCENPQDITDDCGFQCIYRKYGNGCAVNLCNIYDQYASCTSGSSFTESNYKIELERYATRNGIPAVSTSGFGCACSGDLPVTTVSYGCSYC